MLYFCTAWTPQQTGCLHILSILADLNLIAFHLSQLNAAHSTTSVLIRCWLVLGWAEHEGWFKWRSSCLRKKNPTNNNNNNKKSLLLHFYHHHVLGLNSWWLPRQSLSALWTSEPWLYAASVWITALQIREPNELRANKQRCWRENAEFVADMAEVWKEKVNVVYLRGWGAGRGGSIQRNISVPCC